MFTTKKRRAAGEVNAGSTADIAFLLLIFFLVTTRLDADKGIPMMLPPAKPPQDITIKERNVLNILMNSNNQFLVEDEFAELVDLNGLVTKFITNNGVDEDLSENPHKAIVSIKSDRGTDYSTYIAVLDEIKLVYAQLRAQHLGMSVKDFNKLDLTDPKDKELMAQAKEAFPMMISEANPSKVE